MSKVRPLKPSTSRIKKRQGQHHKISKRYLHTYWPYIPLLFVIGLGILVSSASHSKTGVLAYATNISLQKLLSGTNTERIAQGSGNLMLNNQLTEAAQAKANDMAKRNYWSHNTPDGQEPWIFVDAAGYPYKKAGENLAYGFTTTDATISGWMNSPSHRQNLLDPTFKEVGFGFANVTNYQEKGPVTIIVAMYGLSENEVSATSPATTETPAPEVPAATTQTPVVDTPAQPVSRLSALTSGKAPWINYIVAFVSGGAIALLIIRHGLVLRRVLLRSESFVVHHPLLDALLLALVVAGLFLGQVTGFIA